jgi:alpha-tubulin suppressor-like RCC1 family protein
MNKAAKIVAMATLSAIVVILLAVVVTNNRLIANAQATVFPNSGPATGGTDIVITDDNIAPLTKPISQITAGFDFAVAIGVDNHIYTWGGNDIGQLGKGNNYNGASYQENYSPADISLLLGSALSGITIKSVSAGMEHVLALGTNGHVYAWGNNTAGELGKGNNLVDSSSYTPTDISVVPGSPLNGKEIISVTAGARMSFAVDSDGHVYSWGANTYGGLGKGTSTSTSANYSPVDISVISTALNGVTVSKVVAGGYHAMALGANGHVYTWGYNGYGELGKGTMNTSNLSDYSPTDISVLSNSLNGKTVVEIAATMASFSVAVDSDGHVHTWGRNMGDGFLGKGNNSGNLTNNCSYGNCRPADISLLSNDLNGQHIVSVSTGNYGYFTTAVDDNGQVYAWGRNTYGQLGKGDNLTSTANYAPVNISSVAGSGIDGKDILVAANGSGFVVALDADGNIYTWGANSSGQLGRGDNQETVANYLPAELIAQGDLAAAAPTVTLDAGGSAVACVVTSYDANHIYCTTSAHMAGLVTVTVTNAIGTMTLSSEYRFTQTPSAITPPSTPNIIVPGAPNTGRSLAI